MNRSGRIVGGALIGIAVLWLLRTLGALPFSDRTTNQLNPASAQVPPNRPLIAEFDASRTNTAVNPGTGTENLGIPGTGTGNGTVAENSGSGTGNTSGTGTGSGTTPVVPGAW